MKTGQLWSEDLGCVVSKAFYNIKEQVNMKVESTSTKLRLDITKCTIKVTQFGMFELWFNEKRIRYISFMEFMKFKKYVKYVEGLENITN